MKGGYRKQKPIHKREVKTYTRMRYPMEASVLNQINRDRPRQHTSAIGFTADVVSRDYEDYDDDRE